MTIFSRRRIQVMLADVCQQLDKYKIKDLVNRLSDNKPEQMIACELEVALLWGISQISDLKIEPEISNSSSRPDAFSAELFDSPAFIEITTLSDNKLSGHEIMNRATQIISSYANTVEKGIGNFLFFTFNEISSWSNGIFNRKRCVSHDFGLDENLKEQLYLWILNRKYKNKCLRLHNETIDVVVEKKDNRQRQGHNFFSSLPPIAYDIEDNPLYETLRRKARQLSGVPDDAFKVIFITDGGSRLLRRLFETDPQRLQQSGSDIIKHFLKKYSVDAVYVFSPFRQELFYPELDQLIWRVTPFYKENPGLPEEKLKMLAKLLPKPRFEGYQARILHQQEAFSPSKNSWYLGYQIRTNKGSVMMKLSARLLQEYLAGQLSKDEFERYAFSDKNLFDLWLRQGHTIRNIQFEPMGLDEDDDYVLFEFSKDAAASPFTIESLDGG